MPGLDLSSGVISSQGWKAAGCLGFHQLLQANAWTVPQFDYAWFIPYFFKHIIHDSTYHLHAPKFILPFDAIKPKLLTTSKNNYKRGSVGRKIVVMGHPQ